MDDALNAAETSKQEAAAALNDAQAKLRNVDTEAAARREAYEQQAETAKQQLLAEAQKPVSYTHLDVYKRQLFGLWLCVKRKKPSLLVLALCELMLSMLLFTRVQNSGSHQMLLYVPAYVILFLCGRCV